MIDLRQICNLKPPAFHQNFLESVTSEVHGDFVAVADFFCRIFTAGCLISTVDRQIKEQKAFRKARNDEILKRMRFRDEFTR